MEKYDIVTRSITETCTVLCDKRPDRKNCYRALLDLYLHPGPDKGTIEQVLNMIEEVWGKM